MEINRISVTIMNHGAFVGGFNKSILHVPLYGQLKKNSFSIFDVALPKPRSIMTKTPPTSSAFFGVYNKSKEKLVKHAYSENMSQSVAHIAAVYLGHSASCLIRVPVDIYRQQRKIESHFSPFKTMNHLAISDGLLSRFMRNLAVLILRELPFCSIKYPLWEYLKTKRANGRPNGEVETYESAIFGSFAGGTAAAITTPVDLVYKAVYVEKKFANQSFPVVRAIREIAVEKGFKGLFTGMGTRVAMISFGGFLFFGCYEQKRRFVIDDE